jgi:phage N-6-adenine-methyltransferase
MKGGAYEKGCAPFDETCKTSSDPARHRIHFSSATCEWPTPQAFFDELDDEFRFTLDPCSTDENAKCARHFTVKENGLVQSWQNETVYMNPPYGREIGAWMEKALHESTKGATVVCLVPARTDTRWWHDFAMQGEIRFVRGRIKFEGASSSAPFPSAVVIFRSSLFGNLADTKRACSPTDDLRNCNDEGGTIPEPYRLMKKS